MIGRLGGGHAMSFCKAEDFLARFSNTRNLGISTRLIIAVEFVADVDDPAGVDEVIGNIEDVFLL